MNSVELEDTNWKTDMNTIQGSEFTEKELVR